MKRATTALTAACISALVLSGCSTAGSTLTISPAEGEAVSASFDRVECTDTEATTTTTAPDFASVTVHFDDSRDDFRGQAWVSGDRLVYFKADRLDIERDGDRISVTGEGDISIAEQTADSESAAQGVELDTENANQTSGTIAVELVCSR